MVKKLFGVTLSILIMWIIVKKPPHPQILRVRRPLLY